MQQVGGAWALGAAFEARPNALNFLRLSLALEVVLWHAYALLGESWLPARLASGFADIGVDGFFAVSGFLICRAWMRRPHASVFLAARARRILPGLWTCLIVTAFVVVPLAAALGGLKQPSRLGQLHYVVANAGIWVRQWGIDGGPQGVPRPGAWDGSLWSLGYEAGCYIAIAALGVTRLLRPRVVMGAALTFWVISASLVHAGITASGALLWCAPRCGLMFASGATLFMFRDRIALSSRLLMLAAVTVVIGILVMPPDYRLVAAPGIAYLCVAGSLALGRSSRLVWRNDLSYGVYVYGFVIQQALLVVGIRLPWPLFALLSTALVLPVAGLSWFLVEKPVNRLGRVHGPKPQMPGRFASRLEPSQSS